MHFTTSTRGDLVEIATAGKLNMASAPELRRVVAEIAAPGGARIVVNLAGTEFMDSSGLGALVGCLKTARGAGGDLRIANVQEQVRLVLELTNMDRIFTPYSSVETAYDGV